MPEEKQELFGISMSATSVPGSLLVSKRYCSTAETTLYNGRQFSQAICKRSVSKQLCPSLKKNIVVSIMVFIIISAKKARNAHGI